MNKKTILITGGASGIGRATAELFVQEGAFVVITDVDQASGNALARSLGVDCAMFLPLDVADEEAVQSVLEVVRARRGQIDVLFNNAGVADPRASIAEIETDHFRYVVEVVLLGAMIMTRYAVPLMSDGCVIINTTSVTGLSVSGGSSVYAAAKAGLINFTRYAAVELGTRGIRVNSVCPGGIPTPLLRASMGEGAEDMDVQIIRAGLIATQAIAHVNEPSDIAEAVLFLASDQAKGVTGHNLVIDGGYLVANRGRVA